MVLRYLCLSVLKWIVNFMVVTTAIRYLIPLSWDGYILAGPIWLISFAVAMVFAEWIFYSHLASKRDTMTLIVVWMVVSFSLQIFHGFYFLGTIVPIVMSPELYVQYLLEILAILLVAYHSRRRRIKEAFGEGLESD